MRVATYGGGVQRQAGLDGASVDLQLPVTAFDCRACGVIGCCNVCPGKRSQLREQCHALLASACFAAVQQDVRIVGQRSCPVLQRLAVGADAGCVDGVAAQREAAERAMAENLHRFDALAALQGLGKGGQARFLFANHVHEGVGGQGCQQAGVVGHAGVHDEHRCDNAICAHAGDACILGAGAGQGDGGCGGGSFFCFHFLG